jgi:hypothetical protein
VVENVTEADRTRVLQLGEMRDPATVSEMSLRSCGVLDQVMMLLEQTKNNYPSQEFPEETFKV